MNKFEHEPDQTPVDQIPAPARRMTEVEREEALAASFHGRYMPMNCEGWRNDDLSTATILEWEVEDGLLPDQDEAEYFLDRARSGTLSQRDRYYLNRRRQIHRVEKIRHQLAHAALTMSANSHD